MMKPVEIFHIGPQKTATTWVYRCLREHAEIDCPAIDAIHYFNVFYHRGRDWYASYFSTQSGQKKFDPSYSYFRSSVAAQRIYKENPDARLICCLRHPIERAFSHYWHEKKKGRHNYRFDEVLENYDLYSSWIEPGFYARQIETYLQYFPRKNILCQLFDHLQKNPQSFLNDLLKFIDVDLNFEPSVLHRKINVARPIESPLYTNFKQIIRPSLKRIGLLDLTYRFMDRLRNWQVEPDACLQMEQIADLPRPLLNELQDIYRPANHQLEDLLSIKLDDWIVT